MTADEFRAAHEGHDVCESEHPGEACERMMFCGTCAIFVATIRVPAPFIYIPLGKLDEPGVA